MNVIKYKFTKNKNKVKLLVHILIPGQLNTELEFTDYDTEANRSRMLSELISGLIWVNTEAGILKVS